MLVISPCSFGEAFGDTHPQNRALSKFQIGLAVELYPQLAEGDDHLLWSWHSEGQSLVRDDIHQAAFSAPGRTVYSMLFFPVQYFFVNFVN